MEKRILNGNEAIALASLNAECDCYFGYPITPQNEIPHILAKEMPRKNKTFLQAESEVAAINMVYGASSAGARVMTSSSSLGISLMQEGISFISAAHLPCVIVNVMRGGPGLGNIKGAQADYFQATKGGGHGDYHMIVLAPNSVQECYDFTLDAFDLADHYRIPVMILVDGIMGQMQEIMDEKQYNMPEVIDKEWAVSGCKRRERNLIRTLFLGDGVENNNILLQRKYEQIRQEMSLFEEYFTDDSDVVVVAFGIGARIAKEAVDSARENGVKAGLFRPISLFPFPYEELRRYSDKKIIVIELSAGQMLEDVKLSVKKDVTFYGFGGGWCPKPKDILDVIEETCNEQ